MRGHGLPKGSLATRRRCRDVEERMKQRDRASTSNIVRDPGRGVVSPFGWADIPFCLTLWQTGMSAPPNPDTTGRGGQLLWHERRTLATITWSEGFAAEKPSAERAI